MESGRSDCFVAGRRRCSLAGWRPGHSTRHGRPQGHASARISHLRYHLVRTTTYSPPLLLVWLPLSRTHVLRKATTGQSHIAPTNGPWGLITAAITSSPPSSPLSMVQSLRCIERRAAIQIPRSPARSVLCAGLLRHRATVWEAAVPAACGAHPAPAGAGRALRGCAGGVVPHHVVHPD